MKITIQGQDYTPALDAAHPLTIERTLNEPTLCRLWLSLPADGSLTTPLRNQSLAVSGDDGTTYFTGYLALSPLPEYAGMALEGPRYRLAMQAVSDEILLDQLPMAPSKGVSGRTAGSLIAALVAHTGSAALSTQELSLQSMIGNFAPVAGAPWSRSAGQVASQVRAAYRAINGSLTLQQIPVTVHPLSETDGSLSLASLSFTGSGKRALANDVTVCGEHEPVAYATEYFAGDGVTTQFYLAAAPFSTPASKTKILAELFNEPAIDPTVWATSGGAGCFALGAGGLVINGGNGVDGGTLLTLIDTVEMGGTLLLEAVGVTLAAGSAGILAGMFEGAEQLGGCVAGFQATSQQVSGAVSLQPVVQGTPTGACYAVNPANQYTLRVRVHCPESVRATATYRSYSDSGPLERGGQTSSGSGNLQFEIQECVDGVAGMPVTLYDGTVASLSASCQVIAASSVNLLGTMRALNLTHLGSGWVVSTPVNGTARTQRIGTSSEAGECYLESSGKLVFNAGSVPPAGEQIAVSYRTSGRSVGRAVNAASQAALVQAGTPSVATWIGSITNPPARTSADCRNAAMTMAQASASVSALWSGTYKGTRLSFDTDVWPGDALLLNAPSNGLNTQVVVRTVKLSYRASYPDMVDYVIAFANDWADDLAIKTSTAVPADAWLPAPVAPTVLPNLTGLTITALGGSSITVNAGVAPPAGGGFEVRRWDFAFMPGEDPGLVTRGSQATMTFARESANDRFYIRMYDGSQPPNYSEFSTALFINMPLGS
jgi:hypothetical protein